MQAAICSRPPSAGINLNPQSAMPSMQIRFRCSKLELCGPRNDLRFGHRSSRGLRCAPFLAQ
eukprot:10738955-Alexandrium_andersonii.AAC.1